MEEAHRLGMRLHEEEPDPRDRVRLLLEMSRLDIDQVSPGSQVQLFEPLVRQHPDNLPLALTVGLALVRDSRGEPGRRVPRVGPAAAPRLARGLGCLADRALRGVPVRSAGEGVRPAPQGHGRRRSIRQARRHDRPERPGLAAGGPGLSPRRGARAVQRDPLLPPPRRAAVPRGYRRARTRQPVLHVVRGSVQADEAGLPRGAGGPDARRGTAPRAVSSAGRPPRAAWAAPTRRAPGIGWCSATTPTTAISLAARPQDGRLEIDHSGDSRGAERTCGRPNSSVQVIEVRLGACERIR